MSRNSIREDSIFVEKEVRFYLKVLAKAKCQGTNAVMTHDEVGNCLLRDKITTEHPELVTLWDEYCDAKQKAHKEYEAIEKKMIEAVASPVSTHEKHARPQEETKIT